MKRILLGILIVLLLTSTMLTSNTIYSADVSYLQITPLIDKNDISFVNAGAFGNGYFIAAGKPGRVALSKDGISWTVKYCNINEEVDKLVFEGNQFFAFTKNRSVLSSVDGVSWEYVDLAGINFSNISYVHDRYFAYGKDIAMSFDGKIWNIVHNIENGDIHTVIWKNNKFISIGTADYDLPGNPKLKNICYESEDGQNWSNSIFNSEAVIEKVARYNNIFLALGHSYGDFNYRQGYYYKNYQILSSEDGINWRKIKENITYPVDILCTKSKCVIYGEFEGFYLSDDGVSWNEVRNPSDMSLYPRGEIIYGNNRFVRLNSHGSKHIASTDDLINWDINDIISGFNGSLLYCNNKYIVSSYDGITTSEDLLTWHMSSSKEKICFVSPILYQNDIYVAISSDPYRIITSKNCEDWEEVYTDDGALSGIIWDGEKFISVCEKNYILTSLDTKTWEKQTINTDSIITGIAFNGKQYIITCKDGNILISNDFTKWSKQAPFQDEYIRDIIGAEGNWIACTINGSTDNDYINKIYNSKDGVNWKEINIPYTYIDKITYSGNRFLCVARDNRRVGDYANGKVLISPDGVSWNETGDIVGYCYDIGWDGSKYIFLCYGGTRSIYLGLNISTKPARTIEIMVNDRLIDMDVPPITKNWRTLVSLQTIIEILDGKVDWDSSTGTIRAFSEDNVVELVIDNKNAVVNGKTVELDVPAIIENGQIYVPLRFILENLNAEVIWDGNYNTVIVKTYKT